MRVLITLAVLALAAPSVARANVPVAASQSAQAEVLAAMNDSAAGWNAGDLDRFMAVYSDDPETSFVVADGIIKGKDAIAERYRKNFGFDDAAKRGTLTFETLRFTLLDPTHALFVARYRLQIAGAKDVTGPTSLVFVKEAGGWKIVADHSS